MRVMFFKIQNAFDSHCHFLATGQVASGLSLKNLKSAEDVKNLKIQKNYFQNNWLVGFGWDQNSWTPSRFPNSTILDSYFPNYPVFFSRADGHASWVNTAGINELKKKGYDFFKDLIGGKIERDLCGQPTGILFDQAHIAALALLPSFNEIQIRQFLQQAQFLFNRGGFTHARDLSMTLNNWHHLLAMADKKELTMCLEGFVTVESLTDLPRVFEEIKFMKENPNPFLRIQGVKLFLDGSLGSKTAFISLDYLDQKSSGQLCWDLKNVKEVLKLTWQKGFDFAAHAIGDEAVHQAVQIARSVSSEGTLGRLHLEHVQIIRPATIPLMKSLHVTCHMQPCHWLSDHAWLKNIVASDLVKNSFSWESLRKNKIALQFGSDSPIEPTSLLNNYQALMQSATSGWPALNADWTSFHSHPDKKWTNSFTELTDEKIIQVHFNGEPLF